MGDAVSLEIARFDEIWQCRILYWGRDPGRRHQRSDCWNAKIVVRRRCIPPLVGSSSRNFVLDRKWMKSALGTIGPDLNGWVKAEYVAPLDAERTAAFTIFASKAAV